MKEVVIELEPRHDHNQTTENISRSAKCHEASDILMDGQ